MPWLDVAKNYQQINVEQALSDQNSVFYYYQRLIALRKEVKVITTGDYTDLMPEHSQLFCYQRRSNEQTLICINNYYEEALEYQLPAHLELHKSKYIIRNDPELSTLQPTRTGKLKPYECRVLLINYY
ncbi:MAG: trehalose-6-phosphate hydrolase [Psychromonas sp.]|jgi:trehalose-6-phosphate hydrolase